MGKAKANSRAGSKYYLQFSRGKIARARARCKLIAVNFVITKAARGATYIEQ
jgi:hypothetical protein